MDAALATGMGQLDPDLAALRPHKFDDPPKPFDVLVFPNTQIARGDAALRRYSRGFGKDQSGASDGPGPQVHEMPVIGHPVMGRILTHGRNDDTIADGNVSYGEGREQLTHKMLNLPNNFNFHDNSFCPVLFALYRNHVGTRFQ